MKTLGIVGGIAPESTVEYYRLLVRTYRERTGDGSYPPLMLNSIDLTKMLGLIGAGRLDETVDYLSAEIAKLARAGAEDQEYIHDKYMTELVNAVFRDETREALFAIVDRMTAAHQIDAVVLGGTELPLLLRTARAIPLLDTTRIHVDEAVTVMLRE
jgi:aspartate/glutamate racemase